MSAARILRLAAAFIAGFVIAMSVGAVAGLFERGPVQADVDAARASGRADAAAAVEVRLAPRRGERVDLAYRRGILHAEFVLLPGLDQLPNPNDWFRGVDSGRRRVQVAVAAASELGERLGREHGIAEARPGPLDQPRNLRVEQVLFVSLIHAEVRLRWDPVPGALAYRVRQGGALPVQTLPWRRTSYRFTVAIPSLETRLEVQAVRGGEESDWAAFIFNR